MYVRTTFRGIPVNFPRVRLCQKEVLLLVFPKTKNLLRREIACLPGAAMITEVVGVSCSTFLILESSERLSPHFAPENMSLATMKTDNQTGRGSRRQRRSLLDRICDNMAPELEAEAVSSASASTCTATLPARTEELSTKSLEHEQMHAGESKRDGASASHEEFSSLDPFAKDSNFTLGADGLITLSTLLSDEKDAALNTNFKRAWTNQAA